MKYSNPMLAIRVLSELQEEIYKQSKLRKRLNVKKRKKVASVQH
tara:strand:+ start:762 stop:893 length:132 start_codon:yes stop_codon:yes gene_type:complete